MRRKRFSIDATDDHTLLNLTPLIDVVFVVLIMFILIAPMLELDRVSLAAAPERDTLERAFVQESSSIVIHVHPDNTIWLNRRPIAEPQLIAALKQLKIQHPKLIPQLFNDRKAQFGTYQNVKNAVEAAGFEELDVILQPEK